ncbi:MAG: M24 family metallopeptidase [Candidatus Zixiibacteriota bacterium]
MRIDKIRERLEKEKLDAIIISHLKNIRYLSNYTGSNAIIVITDEKAYFYTDFRYKTQVEYQVPDEFEKIVATRNLIDELKDLKISGKVGFEADHITVSKYEKLKENLEDIELIPIKKWVEELRGIKDNDEIENIQKAVKITEKALEEMKKFIKPGITEREYETELQYIAKKLGADGESFSAIVASGDNSAKPHAGVGDREFLFGDLITVDCGHYYNGYASDLTRTFVIGEPDNTQKEIYETVLKAQLESIAAAKEGKSGKEIDGIARKIIEDAGYGEYFGHALGHSVGLDVHDGLVMSQKTDTVLKDGMVMTFEPGIYIPEFGGVRIEDDVVIRKDGAENLTSFTKSLEDMIIPI